VAGFCGHGNETSGSIRKDFFDKLSDNQLFKYVLHRRVGE
jgi:hypothetical protein